VPDRRTVAPKQENTHFSVERRMRKMNWIQLLVIKRIILAVKRVEFITDSMSYIIPRGRWFHGNVPNIPAPTQDKIDYLMDSFYEEFESIVDKFHKFHMKIFRRFPCKCRQGIFFRQAIGKEILHDIINDNRDRELNFATVKNLGRSYNFLTSQHSSMYLDDTRLENLQSY
jgi:hypothetical protein